MDENRYANALANLEKIQDLIDSYPPSPNPARVIKIRGLCRMGINDTYVAEKSAKVARLAEQYFSAKKWARHGGGAEGVYQEIKAALYNLKHQINYLSTRKN